jgi:flagellar P-ring protein precursor FlgI
MLSKMGIAINPDAVRVKNIAAVMVTATLPPFVRTGSTMDVLISSVGDASSLEGGTLLMTPLFGTDGEVYAIAQGPISVGGFSAGSGGGTSIQKNHPTVGRIANGATIEKEIGYSISDKSEFQVALSEPDFTTALRAEKTINEKFGEGTATAIDSGTLNLQVPAQYANSVVLFMSELELLNVEPDLRARIILNERTGTVVIGESVRVSTVAVSHGSLSVMISSVNQVSQPGAFSDGETVVIQNSEISAFEEPANLNVIGGFVTIGDLVRGLNAMGVTPRDLIAILQAIKAAGALSAELELM